MSPLPDEEGGGTAAFANSCPINQPNEISITTEKSTLCTSACCKEILVYTRDTGKPENTKNEFREMRTILEGSEIGTQTT
jgi:hypothetical protein